MEKNMTVRTLDIEQIKKGMHVCYDTTFGVAEVEAFAELSGDVSPLHVDTAYGQTTVYGTNLVHGMLVASHFSTVVGVLLPGKPALLSSMQLEFVQPIPVGSPVTISGKVRSVSKMTAAIALDLSAMCHGAICVVGKATVTVRAESSSAMGRAS